LIKNQGDRILGRLSKQRAKKLNYLQHNTINKHVTMAFCSEMAGTDGRHMLDIENLQENNGSIAVSPSATSYFATYIKRGDEASLNYLRSAMKADGGMPNVTPFSIFETAWSLWNLSLIPDLKRNERLQAHIDLLSRTWQPKRGTGHSEYYSVKDSDDTSLVYEVLSRFGIEKDLASVLIYEEQDYFRCFDLEANPSVSANIHVLGALGQSGLDGANASIRKVLRFLQKMKGGNTYWVDKWHISPYYTTSHAIIACADFAKDLVKDAVQWILDTQNIDGSWGTYLPTAEETAYAIQALWVWNEKVAKVPKQALQDGARWLQEHMDPPYPPLWIGKCLYNPTLVIRSAVISALALTQ
jgi:halimadienyl-diphosphate synthase